MGECSMPNLLSIWESNKWLTRLYDNTIVATPVRYLPPHAGMMRPPQPDLHSQRSPCPMQETANKAVSLQSVALPDLICTTTTAIQPNQTIAVLPVGHPWLRLITPPTWQTAGLLPNASITHVQGESPEEAAEETCTLVSLRRIEPDEMIPVND